MKTSLENIKIAIGIPLQQHSYRTAEALTKEKILYKYYTTVFYNSEKFIYKFMKKILNPDLCKRMEGKYNSIFEPYVKIYNEFIGLIYLFVIRKDNKRIFLPHIHNFMNWRFGNKVAEDCKKNKIDIIIMYDTQAYNCFKKLNKKSPNTKKILDMCSVSSSFIKNEIITEIDNHNIFSESMKLRLKEYSKRMCKKYEKEIQMADYFIVACRFAKDTLLENGVEEKKIFYLPLGVDTDNFIRVKNNKVNNRLRFIFVGRVESAKGIYYLLEAFRELAYLNIELDVVGEIRCDRNLLKQYETNVNFVGVVRKDEITKFYSKADIFILPSLWEGFSLSLFEALASGLPVIATNRSCAADIITDGIEGFVINPIDIEDIKEKIIWYVNNQHKIKEMSDNAVKLSKKYTWNEYDKNLMNVLYEVINDTNTKEI